MLNVRESHKSNCSKKNQKLSSHEPSENEDCEIYADTLPKFDQAAYRKALAEMIIIDGLPLTIVEREGFRRFMSIVQPRFQLVSSFELMKDCHRIYRNEKVKLRDLISKSNSKVSLSINFWNSIHNISHLCVTAHFIDDDWKLHRKILNFSLVPSDMIGEAVEMCLLNWGIETVGTLTVNNSTSNDVAIAYLKDKLSKKNSLLFGEEFFRVTCLGHILNSVFHDALLEYSDCLYRIREVVKYVNSSVERILQFKACAEKEKITCKSVIRLDDSNTWNTTYFMLEDAINFQKAFERLENEDSMFVYELADRPPTMEDWHKARELIKFLKLFYNVVRKLSGSPRATSNLCFEHIYTIQHNLIEWAESSELYLRSMAIKMKEIFDHYWGNIDDMNMLLLVQVVLDPRYKMHFIKFGFNILCPSEGSSPSQKGLTLIEKVTRTLNCLFQHYKNADKTEEKSEMEVDDTLDPNGDFDDYDAYCEWMNRKWLKHLKEKQEKG